jgi:hypothetical protein
MSEAPGDISGQLVAIELETRHPVALVCSQIAGFVALKDDGPCRVLFSGGGHVDICGSADIWRREFMIALIVERAEAGK